MGPPNEVRPSLRKARNTSTADPVRRGPDSEIGPSVIGCEAPLVPSCPLRIFPAAAPSRRAPFQDCPYFGSMTVSRHRALPAQLEPNRAGMRRQSLTEPAVIGGEQLQPIVAA